MTKPMAATVNPVAGLTRDELNSVIEPLVVRLTSLEAVSTRGRIETDAVSGSEFRMFKWLGIFALAAVLGGFGLLYEQIADVRVGLERMHSGLLKEIHSLRDEMHVEHAVLRNEIAEVRERVVRVETLVERTSRTGGTEALPGAGN